MIVNKFYLDKLVKSYPPDDEDRMFYDQIRFYNYLDKEAPKEYWSTIEDIAELIACGLESKEIKVACHKEKFGEVRVYVNMSEDENKSLKELKDYRYVYLKVMRMFPEYNSAIFGGADYSYLLFQNKDQFEEEISQMDEHSKNYILDKMELINKVSDWK